MLLGTDISAVGTPTYLAPQLVEGFVLEKGVPPDLDHFAADTWSLGATSFHILSGTAPFDDARDIWEHVDSQRHVFSNFSIFDHPRNSRHGVSQAAQEFVRPLLKVDPKSRPNAEAARSQSWARRYPRPFVPRNWRELLGYKDE